MDELSTWILEQIKWYLETLAKHRVNPGQPGGWADRAFADAQSKRRLIEEVVPKLDGKGGWAVLRYLALSFDDRPGYRVAWLP